MYKDKNYWSIDLILQAIKYLPSSKCPLSLNTVHNSPPRQLSISIYKYLASLNVLYNLTIKSQLASPIISFSDMMCCCCFVFTIWSFFICLRAYDLDGLPCIWTSSTLPNPPTPKVATMLSSDNLTFSNSSLSLQIRIAIVTNNSIQGNCLIHPKNYFNRNHLHLNCPRARTYDEFSTLAIFKNLLKLSGY